MSKHHRHSMTSTRDCDDCEALRAQAHKATRNLDPFIVPGDRVAHRDHLNWRGTVVKVDRAAHLADVHWSGDAKPTSEHAPNLIRVATP